MVGKSRFQYNVYVIAVLGIFALSLVFAGVTLSVLSSGYSADATRVGSIYLGDRKSDEFATVLTQEIAAWKTDSAFVLHFQGHEFSIDLDLFDFDNQQTVAQIQRNQNNSAVFTLSTIHQEELRMMLEETFTEAIIDHFDYQSFLDDLMAHLSSLRHSVRYEIHDYLDEEIGETVIASALMTDLPVGAADAIISQTVLVRIASLSRFSLLEALQDTTLSNENLSIIASGIEKITLGSDFSGFLFHTHPELPDWAEYGANARILRVSQYDFSFFNGLTYGFEIRLERTDAVTLRFDLVGYPFVNDYSGALIEETEISFDTLYLSDPTLGPATPGVLIVDTEDDTIYRVLVQAGVNGKILYGIRTITYPGTDPIEERIFAEQYLPIPAIYRENIVPKDGE